MRFDAKEFGGRIRDLRKKKGITQEQLSIMLNVSANHLAKVETGSRCCSIELLQDPSSCLNVRTDVSCTGIRKDYGGPPGMGIGKSRILFFNAQKRGRIGKRFSI